MSIPNKDLKTGIPFPLKELACNYVAFEKGNQVIKRVKFTSKDDMIDNPDIFQIEHSVLLGARDTARPWEQELFNFRSQSARIIPGRI